MGTVWLKEAVGKGRGGFARGEYGQRILYTYENNKENPCILATVPTFLHLLS
jgi:hypothetical protein